MTLRDPSTLMCKEVVELVTEFLSNSLSPQDRALLEQHLLVCPPCTIHVAQVKSTITLTAELGTSPAGDPAPALIELFRQRKHE